MENLKKFNKYQVVSGSMYNHCNLKRPPPYSETASLPYLMYYEFSHETGTLFAEYRFG